MSDVPSLLRLLGDETRLRLIRVLGLEPMNVSELTAVLGVAQSGVSRHLGLLKDAGLVEEQRAGTFTVHRLHPDLQTPTGPDAGLWAWLQGELARRTAETKADDSRLAEVRRVRRDSFDQHRAGDERRQLVPGRSWPAWSRALGFLLPAVEVADLGCGEGYLTVEAARWAKRVVAVDRSKDVLAQAKALATRRKIRNITWKQGELDRLPMADAAVDVALLSQALHHADDPGAVLAEAHRVLRPGGRLVVLDLRRHEETWVRAKLGDRWLGFDDEVLKTLLTQAGFVEVIVRVGARRSGDPFTVLIATGQVRS
jgi:ubiquinone/menaquinone biosynthesis C-methylase UbiE/DNA-binding transcriptional ArsR family regulator